MTTKDLNNLKHYCVLPFNSVSISANGEIRHCCNGGHGLTDTFFVQDVDVNGLINNPFIHDIRESFLKDERHPKCTRCWEMEDMGVMSFREVANRHKNYNINTTGVRTFKKELNFEDIEYIDLTLGNKCNLACRMCTPTSSSLLAKQQKDMGIWQGDVDIDHSDTDKEKILELFRKAVNLKNIYMLGGEPLINPMHFEILDLLIETGQSKNIEIFFNTNLQVNKISSYYDRWEKFARVRIQASIDGSGDCYEYIRYPGKWDKLYKNYKELSKIIDDQKFFFSVSPVLQNINAHNMYDLVNEMRYTNGRETGFFFIPISGPNQLNLVPKRVLERAMNNMYKLPNTQAIPRTDILRQLSAAHKKEINVDELKHFFNITKGYDKFRKQNLFEMAPHFEELADEYGIEKW